MNNAYEHTSQAAAWKAGSFASAAEYSLRLDDADRAELLAAVRALPAGTRPETTGRKEFPLPRLAERLRAAADDVREGRGFVVVRGLPTEDGVTVDEYIAATWAIHTKVATSSTSGYSFAPPEWGISWRAIHPGAPGSSCFAKKDPCGSSAVPMPSTQRLRVTGRPASTGRRCGAIRA